MALRVFVAFSKAVGNRQFPIVLGNNCIEGCATRIGWPPLPLCGCRRSRRLAALKDYSYRVKSDECSGGKGEELEVVRSVRTCKWHVGFCEDGVFRIGRVTVNLNGLASRVFRDPMLHSGNIFVGRRTGGVKAGLNVLSVYRILNVAGDARALNAHAVSNSDVRI